LGRLALGLWVDRRGSNFLVGGAPFYRTYRCADDRHMAVGCNEPQFYAEFLHLMGLESDPLFSEQLDKSRWPDQTARLAEVFATRERADWEKLFEGTGACATPVLSLTEAASHPQMAARGTFARQDGVVQPAPAPRFDRTPLRMPPPATASRGQAQAVLVEMGIDSNEVNRLFDDGVLVAPE
jgi:alpha-methylacyl-CoA racemase